MNSIFISDYKHYYHEDWNLIRGGVRVIRSWTMKLLLFGRISQQSRFRLLRKLCLVLAKIHGSRHGIEIKDFDKIGPGLQIVHPYNITVNPGVNIGENCTLMKGCTIGSIRGGNRAGVPKIGNNVVVSLNATIVGGIEIGNDVLIASNAFVNFDVPAHSVVIGNPGVIHHKEDATSMY